MHKTKKERKWETQFVNLTPTTIELYSKIQKNKAKRNKRKTIIKTKNQRDIYSKSNIQRDITKEEEKEN